MRQRQPRQHNEQHLAFIRGLPCVVCKNNIETEAAHIKTAVPKVGKRDLGVGEKADDSWTVPLCGTHHRAQHVKGERIFWADCGIDPILTALALYRVSGDHAAGEQIVSLA